MAELYFSTDVEADGPIPGPNSMLSFGSAVFDESGKHLGGMYFNLELLPDAKPDPKTQAFWAENQEAYDATRQHLAAPEVAMPAYADWVEFMAKQHKGNPVFVAYPVAYDFMFVYWYLMRFAGRSPFRPTGLDIRSYFMGMSGRPFGKTSKRYMPKHFLPNKRHTHIALDDAEEQGELFANLLRANHSRPKLD